MKVSNLIYLVVSLMLFGFQSCKPEEELLFPAASTKADFNWAASNNSYYPCEISFVNKSLNATGYLWNFGNGETSTEMNPVAHYSEPGFYTVSLTCSGENDVYYNELVKSTVLNIKDPDAGKTHVMYFTTRGPSGGNVFMVILDGSNPVPQPFAATGIARPYGIAVDTANKKVFVSDYENGAIYRFNADGTNMEMILSVSVSGQEIVDYPHGLLVINNKLYWGRSGGIYRSNLDGTGAEVFINTGSSAPEFPLDLSYDSENGKIYFVNDKYDFSGGIFSVKVDGTEMTNLVPDVDGTAIELDLENAKMYSTVYALAGSQFPENGLYMMNLDGSAVTKIGEFGAKATWGISLDPKNDFLYWSYKISNSDPDGKIIRANLDGSGQTDWLTGVSPHAMIICDIKL
jgi:PKD repeat protein